MKKIIKKINLVILLFVPSLIFSQSIGLGSKWIYKGTSMSSNLNLIYEIKRDTILGSESFWVLEKGKKEFIGIGEDLGEQPYEIIKEYFIKENSGKVYLKVEDGELFLFDLSPTKGDNWAISEISSYMCVDSISLKDTISIGVLETVEINGQSIERFELSDSGILGYGDFFYKNIGPYQDFFPVPSNVCTGIDNLVGFGENLFCYTDKEGVNFFFGDQGNTITCDLILPTRNLDDNRFLISTLFYPNPVNTVINIKDEVKRVTLFSLKGEIILNEMNKTIQIDNLIDGIYFLQCELEEGIVTQKIIINHE